jgi:small GTP-binding protein
MADPSEPGRQHKVVLLGDSNVGKTSLIGRKALSDKRKKPKPTLGCHGTVLDFTVNGKTITLQFWDTAGQEIYRSLVPVCLRGASCALLLFDVCDADSFKNLDQWSRLIDDVLPENTHIFIVANKIDLVAGCAVGDATARDFATAHRAKSFKVSALSGEGVDHLFSEVGKPVARLAITCNEPRTIQQSREENCDC